MKRRTRASYAFLGAALLGVTPAAAAADGGAAFVCTSPAFGTLRVFLQEHRREARWERAGLLVHRWELSAPQLSSAMPFGEPGWLRYFGPADHVELATRTRVVGGADARAVADLVFAADDVTVQFDTCWKQTVGAGVEPDDGASWLSMIRLDRAVFAVDQSGALIPEALAAFAFAARREAGTNVVRRDRCERLARYLPMLSTASATRVSDLLEGGSRTFWKGCLAATRHRYFPETKRFAAWTKEGLRQLVEVGVGESAVALVVAGTRSFLASRGAAAPEPKRMFLAETNAWARQLSPAAGERLVEVLTREEMEWLLAVWLPTPAAEPLRNLVEIDVAAAEFNEGLAKALENGSALDFTDAQRSLTQFLTRPESQATLRRRRFAQQTGPLLLRLSAEERQRLSEWLAPKERAFVEEAERIARRP